MLLLCAVADTRDTTATNPNANHYNRQQQVLSILDGSASCWPGVSAAQTDLEQLVKLAGQHLSELEKQAQQLLSARTRLQQQNEQLSSKLKGVKGGIEHAMDVVLNSPVLVFTLQA